MATVNKDFKVKHGLSVTGGATFGESIAIGEPTADTHAATKLYVDSAVFSSGVIYPVIVATTGPINLTTGTAPGAEIDGLVISEGNRILVKNQTLPEQNGIYEVQASGPAIRAYDYADAGSIRPGGIVHVLFGSVNTSTSWTLSVLDFNTIDSDPLVYTLVGPLIPGVGLLTNSQNEISINQTVVAQISVAENFIKVLDPGILRSSLTQVGDLESLTVVGDSDLDNVNVAGNLQVTGTEATIDGNLQVDGNAVFSGNVSFNSLFTILDPVNPNNPASKDYVDNLLNQTSVEIKTIDDLSNFFNGYESRFIPTYQGFPVELKNPFNLLLTIDGIIQSVGYPDYVWQSVMPRVGFRIDNDGYIAFPEPIPVGSSFDARILVGSEETQQTKVYPFKAMDIVLGGY